MRRTVQGIQALNLKFDTIISSPYLRARQTAEIVAKYGRLMNRPYLKKQTIHFTNNLLPPATVKELLQEVQKNFPKSKNILFVGHEPHLSGMICSLLQCDKPLTIDLKKGGLCYLSFRQGQAALNWLLTPRQLSLMAL